MMKVHSVASPQELTMSSIRPFRFGALAAILALAAACSDSTGPIVDQPADLGKVLAELQPAQLAPIASQISAAPIAGLKAPEPSSCSYDAASKSFVCPNVSVTGVVVSRSFTLYDANDNPQAAFDPATTAAISMTSSFSGTVTSGGSTLTIDQQQDHKLTGLLTGVHVLNGTTLGHVNGTLVSGTTTTPIASTISTNISGLVIPNESTGPNRFPKAGVITALATTTVGALPTVTVNTSIAFDGTSKAAVTLTVNGLSTHCTVDLSAETAAFCTT
jgi:hypothetical protein